MNSATVKKPARKPAAKKAPCGAAAKPPDFLKGADPRIVELYEVSGRLKRALG